MKRLLMLAAIGIAATGCNEEPKAVLMVHAFPSVTHTNYVTNEVRFPAFDHACRKCGLPITRGEEKTVNRVSDFDVVSMRFHQACLPPYDVVREGIELAKDREGKWTGKLAHFGVYWFDKGCTYRHERSIKARK